MRTKIPQIAFQAVLTALFAILVSAASGQAILPEIFEVSPENFDRVRSPALPSGWEASQGMNVPGAPLWVTSAVSSQSAPNDAFSTAPDNILDNRLDTPQFPFGGFLTVVRFWHSYNLASGLDGAVLEFSSPSINGGAFTDVTDPAVGGQFNPGSGYNGTISASFQSPIAGRMAWTGNSGGYVFVNLSFPPGIPPGRLRFRMASDNAGASGGWRIDTFSLQYIEGPSPTPTPPATPTPTATPIPTPCGGPNVIADSSFEAGTPWPAWTVQTSTNFGTPLCDTATCGSGGPSQPYAGSNWAWFGGAGAAETATLGQSVTFPAGGQATLSFEMRVGAVSFPLTDVLNVRVDGTVMQSYPEPGTAENAYSLRTIDVGAFADGASHNILFEYIGPTTGSCIYAVDNIMLTDGVACPTPPATVTPTATPSASPTATIFPTVTPTPSDCPGTCGTPTPPPPPSPTVSPTATATPPPTPSPTASPTATPPPGPVQALNISTRLRVETGDRVMIGGLIINGTESKRVAIRGIGPSLSNSGLSDALADPTLELRGPDGALLYQNDDWQNDPAQAAQLTALGLALQNNKESGMVVTLEPGAYTTILAGKNQTSGVGLVEIYDVDTASASQLANISTRGFVQTADNVMIGGFILGQGTGSATVAVRGIGPSLSQSGLSGVLADPTLELHDGNGALLIANDNWQDDPVSAGQLDAFGLAPSNALESGIITTLPPGLFTAILAGKNGGVGLGLVEIYGDLHGETLTVTSTADSGPGSLRDAIFAANHGDTIQFDPALKDQTINLTSGELVIDKNITISGFLLNHVTVQPASGSPSSRIVHVRAGRTVTIEGLRIRGGGGFSVGGGVLNVNATLTLSHCAVQNNTSLGGEGGGIYSGGGNARLTIVNSSVSGNAAFGESPGGFGQGGGINSQGMLTIINSVVSGNTVSAQPSNPGSAGGIFSGGTAEISNSTIEANAGGARGGGIVNGGSMTITNSTISGNTTIDSGGGIENVGPLTITNSTISGNSVGSLQGFGDCIDLSGGTLQIQNSILNGSGTAGTISANSGTVTSLGYNLSSDDAGGFLTATGDQINTNPMLGPLQDNGGASFTHQLLSGSPAINAGDPNFTPPPLDDQRGPGYDRVVGGRIDIGSFEVQP